MKNKVFKTLNTIKILIFAGILIIPTLAWLLVISLFPEARDRMDSRVDENRTKAEFPTSFHASTITKELEDYYNDHAPFRSLLILTYQKGESRLESIYLSSIKPGLSNMLYGNGGITEEEVGNYDIGSLFGETGTSSDNPEKVPAPPVEPSSEEHHYIETARTDATCTKPGSILYECSDCGKQYTEKLPAKGHQNIYAATVEASYTEYGCDLYLCTECMYLSKTNITGKLIDTSYLAPSTVNEILLGRFDWLFFTGNDSISYYQGTNTLNGESLQNFLNTAIELNTLCESKNIQLQLMIAPNKEQVYPEFMPTYTINEGPKREEQLVEYFKANSGPSLIYPIEELKATKPYWPVYYSHDTHWNRIGSFIATQAMYKEMGLPTTNIFDLKVSEEERIGGDLVMLSGGTIPLATQDMEYSLEYKPEVIITESSGIYDADYIYHCCSTSENKCNMVMVSDSFRINMIPYLSKDFSDCTILHYDYLEASKPAIQNADVLIFTDVERLDTALLNSMKATIKILKES